MSDFEIEKDGFLISTDPDKLQIDVIHRFLSFPPGNISSAFEEIRRVLEREGLIESA